MYLCFILYEKFYNLISVNMCFSMLNIIHVWQRNGKWKRTNVSASNIPPEIFTYLHIIAKVFLPPQEQMHFKNVLEI